MATISNTPRPGYVWDSTDNCWYPIGVGAHSHNEIPKTVVDAKGDLIVGTGADTVARKAVGSDGSYLIADSTQTTGVNWAGPSLAAGKNAVINGGFDIWQRGTSFTSVGYCADRWYRNGNTGRTYSRQITNDTTNLPFIQYAMRVQRDSGNTVTNTLELWQNFETVNSIPYAGKTVTLSFYARAGANFSAASSQIGVYVVTGTGTDQNWSGGYTGAAYPINNQRATLTTTWQRFTFTGTLATTETEIMTYFNFDPTGTAGANDYFEITGVQLELGSSATPFSRAGGTIQGELAACQRYYCRLSGGVTYSTYGVGYATSTTTGYFTVSLPVQMRVNPNNNALEYGNIAILLQDTGTYAITGLTYGTSTGANTVTTLYATGASGLTANRPYHISNNNNTAGYIGFNAEL